MCRGWPEIKVKIYQLLSRRWCRMLTRLYDLLCCLKDDWSFGVQMMIVQILDKHKAKLQIWSLPLVFAHVADGLLTWQTVCTCGLTRGHLDTLTRVQLKQWNSEIEDCALWAIFFIHYNMNITLSFNSINYRFSFYYSSSPNSITAKPEHMPRQAGRWLRPWQTRTPDMTLKL
jgi:hypothetical protein